jgi:hypothetical protein
MVLLVLGVPILVLALAMALAQLETMLLPARDRALSGRDEAPHNELSTRPSPGPGDVRGVERALTSRDGTTRRPQPDPPSCSGEGVDDEEP